MVNMNKIARSLFVSLGSIGSLFVKKTVDGKYEVAVAPIIVAFAIGSSVTCAVQKDEPFRTCVKNTMGMFQEVIYAN